VGIKTISSPASPCSGWKAGPVTRPDTLRVAPGGPRIVLTFERAEPVGRSLAASPVERLGLRLTSTSTNRIRGHLFQLEDFCPRFSSGQRFLPLANLFDIKETGLQASRRRFFGQAAGRRCRQEVPGRYDDCRVRRARLPPGCCLKPAQPMISACLPWENLAKRSPMTRMTRGRRRGLGHHPPIRHHRRVF
jgi:hypothetical protein